MSLIERISNGAELEKAFSILRSAEIAEEVVTKILDSVQ
jgi:hypothetical protein